MAGGYDFAERLLANQRQFADEVITAASPLLPAGQRRSPRSDAGIRGTRPHAGRNGTRQRRKLIRGCRVPSSPARSEGGKPCPTCGKPSGKRSAPSSGEQRKRAGLSLRQLAELTSLSNPYLSQIERGLHQPSVRVLKAISDALNLSAETLLAQAGLIDAMAGTGPDGEEAGHEPAAPATEDAIRADQRLSEDQKAALIAVYRSMLG